MALVFEYSWHVLEICSTNLLYGVLCLKLSLILKLATVASCEWANLFECSMFLLSNLTLTKLSNLWLPLIARVVIDIGNWHSVWNTWHTCSWMIALLWMSSKILTDALRCIDTNLLRIWIVLLSIFLRITLIGFFPIMCLDCFHTVIRLLENKLCLRILLLSWLWLRTYRLCCIQRIILAILGYTGGKKISWFPYLARIYGFCLFVWIKVLSILLFTAKALRWAHW